MRYTIIHKVIQKLAASGPISWMLARVLHRLDRLALRLSRGRWSWTGLLAGVPVVMMTTTGAHSGAPRTVPLLAIRDRSEPGSFAVIASNWGQSHLPGWYFNLKADPRAMCAFDGEAEPCSAQEATGADYDRLWTYATETYAGYMLYRRRAGRRIPIMIMRPGGR